MQRLRNAFLLIAAGLCLLSLAANPPLMDPDDGLHAAIAQEMLQRHDYVTPTFLGEPFLDKPILFFWAEAASLRVFGMRAAAVHLPPLLFGLLGAVATAWLARSLFGARSGYAAGIVYATMLLPLGVSEVAVHDIALVPFLALACDCAWRAADARRPLAWSVPMGVLLGLSILTKGLVGVVFVGLFALSIAATRPRVFLRLFLVGAVAAAIGATIASPWYIAMERAHPGYLRYYFVERHVEGYLTATQRHAGRGWWYYLGIVGGGALPWLPFAFGAAREVRRAAPRMVVALWFVSGLVFLSIGESKLATYALPVFPALAILIGDYLARSVSSRERPPAFAAGLIACGAAAALLPVVAALGLRARFGVSGPWLLAVAVAASLAIALACRRAWSAREDRLFAWLGGAVFVSLAVVIVTVLPRAADRMTARDLASLLNRRDTLPSRVLVLDERIGSVIFYLSPGLRAQATPERFTGTTLPGAFERLRAEAPDAVLAVRDDQVDRVQRLLPGVRADAALGRYSIFSFQTLRAAAAGVSAGGSGRTE